MVGVGQSQQLSGGRHRGTDHGPFPRIGSARLRPRATTCASVEKVGGAVGFTRETHFSRAFKKQFGITPRERRMQHWTA
ncbi:MULTISPECIES: helix-turn-helix domain-containing protein [unclassified Rhodococcus (in: high G+C Gram-positive bacteria)]|uniref:helix-turn-helix domain-containing protein n=1 Tax=unclassified Rhodococcus (in: high G+C Gram-positive bacteria) TaxID=192944 RepID=UPI00163AA7EF|nr:helix-turn-helix domain-containing protein [Rhodococcus sp. 3A]